MCFKVIYSCFAGAFGLVLSLEETFDTQIACGRCLPLEKSYETAWIPGHHRFPENHYAMNYWCSYFSAVSLIAVAASKTCAFLWTVSCSDFNNAMTRCQRMHSSMCTLTWLLWSYKSVSSDGNIVMQSCIIFGSWDHKGIGRLVDRATNLCAHFAALGPSRCPISKPKCLRWGTLGLSGF